ncbi:MAG: c-type cytochrome [Gemmatimonadaceae bacterium]
MIRPEVALAQTPDSTTVRSTLAGVYTETQATRGKDVYAGQCRSCHTVESHAGTTFEKGWAGKLLSDLFTFIVESMPESEPGSLSTAEYTDALAHILQANGMPPGAQELVGDTLVLRRIRIEMRPPRGAADAASGFRFARGGLWFPHAVRTLH